jgi:hypothetical protein
MCISCSTDAFQVLRMPYCGNYKGRRKRGEHIPYFNFVFVTYGDILNPGAMIMLLTYFVTNVCTVFKNIGLYRVLIYHEVQNNVFCDNLFRASDSCYTN